MSDTTTKTESDLITEIVADLTAELSSTDDDFNADVLTLKVKQALREVKSARKYPSAYTETMIVTDIENYYANIRDIALYDYNQVGGEFETQHNESSISRQWVDRDTLFNGIIPLSSI